MPVEIQRKQMDLTKQQFTVEKQQRDLKKLKADYERMTLKAPVAGIVYHGQCKRGSWVNSTGGNSRLIDVGSTVPKDVVAITIVQPRGIRLHADLSEKQMAAVKSGATGIAKSPATEQFEFPIKVVSVDSIPIDESKYDCVLEFAGENVNLLPGMTCEVKVPVYEAKEAILVPKASVFSDDDGISYFVYVVKSDANERRSVTVGKTSGDDLEIVSGLTAGDKILKKKPE